MVSAAVIGIGSLFAGAVNAVPTSAPGYERTYIGAVPGTASAPNGGMAFLPSNSNTLLFGNPNAATPSLGTILSYTVTRNAQNHVTGFAGGSSVFATAPGITNNGLAYGPGGVLFYSAGTSVGEIKPGSSTVDKTIDLASISGFTFAGGGTVNEITSPTGVPGKANIIVHYPPTSANFYEATFTPDGSGTYDISSPTFTQFVGNMINYDHVPAGFASAPDVYATAASSGVGSMALDANDRPAGFSSIDNTTAGAGAVDPLTGDYLFVHFGTEPGVHVISAVPEPATATMLGVAASGILVTRRRRMRDARSI